MPTDLQYPTGRFAYDAATAPQQRDSALAALSRFPDDVRALAATLTDAQLDTRYRDGGWTARQVIHHVADSHLNAYVRTRWLLTEDRPTLKGYDEKGWAELPDAAAAPVDLSLDLLASLHRRWHLLLTALPPDEFAREIIHPEHGALPLERLVQMYAWHGRHHLGHLQIVAGAR